MRARAARRCAVVGAVTVSVLAAVLVGCGASAPVRTGAIVWHACGDIQCAHLAVPLDRAHPGGRRIVLALARRPAGGRSEGVLFTNPGGPGASGIDLVRAAGDVFDPSLLERFDVVSWDPRGVGASAPVRCTDRLDFFFAVDRSRTDAAAARANVAAARRLVAACAHNDGAELPFVSTSASVDDMDAIRAAMALPRIDYLGYSYGTYLGALYARRYPQRLRAMVLDGAVDPAQSYADATIAQAAGFDRALGAFFAWCRRATRCPFAGGRSTAGAFRDLMATIESEPLPAKVGGEARTLHRGEADIGVAAALYDGLGRGGWPDLARALAQAAQGDGSGLLTLADGYTGRRTGGTYDNETAAFYAIGCLDAPAPRSVAAVRRLEARAAKVAPYFGASNVWLGLPCSFWPAPAVGRIGPVHAPHAPAVLVIGTTGDPATPYASARALVHQLGRARLLTFVGEGHTAYGRGDRCVEGAVDRYLTGTVLPPAGARCR